MTRIGVSGTGWVARSAAVAGIAFASLGCSSKAAENVDAVVAPLELNFLNYSESSVVGKGVNLVTTASEKGASPLAKDNVGMTVEAIRYAQHAYSDGVVTSCGATFVSPHFAITAAHCVGPQRGFQPTPTGPRVGNFAGTPGSCPSGSCAPGTYNDHQPFFHVEHYNTTNLNIGAIPYLVQGTWTSGNPAPTSTYTIKSATITMAQGYIVDDNAPCSVYAQCEQNTWGRNDNCPLTADDADIALISCPGRMLRNYARVASVDGPRPGTNIEVWWFHELLYLQIPGTGLSPYMPAGNVDHYGIETTELDNYHYFQLNQPVFQLFPLVSKWDASQHQYADLGTKIGQGTWQNEVSTFGEVVEEINVPICHGTSGSGVFQVDSAGNHLLLGPMDIKGDNFDHGQAPGTSTSTLCDYIADPNNTASLYRSAYIQLRFTQALANMQVVVSDRAGTVPNP